MVKFFISRPIFAAVIAILMVVIGIICILILPVAQYPSIVPPAVQVTSQYIGASANVVSQTVTTPLERSINGVQGMLYMSSNSTNSGASAITITFDVGYDVDIAAVDVLNASTTANALLPDEVNQTGVTIKKVSSNMVLVVNLLSDRDDIDANFLGNYADIHIAPVLSRVEGVGNVNNFGLLQYAIRVWLNPDKMASMSISPQEVISAIREQNKQAAVGVIGQPPVPKDIPFQYQITTLGQLSDVEQFANIIVRTAENGQIVRLSDLGRVEMGAANYSTTTQFNGKTTASLAVFQLPGSNAIQVAQSVREAMTRLEKDFPEGVHFQIAYDTTRFITESLKEVIRTLFEAIVLVVIVVFVFLQNWRTTLIPSIAIPVSLIGTFALFAIFGFSINTLSLLGLVLAIGLVVDDAIVVVENVEKKLEQGVSNIKEATLLATREVQGPIIATTLILLAVFIPVAFIPGMIGRLYNQFALAIAFSVGLSGINSLSLSPALCGILLSPKKPNKFFLLRWFETGYNSLQTHYNRWVIKAIEYKYLVLVLFGVLSVLTFIALTSVSPEFMPEEDQGYFMVIIKKPNAASLYRTEKTVEKVVSILKNTNGVANTISINGYNIIDGISQPDMAVIFAVLTPWEDRAAKELHVKSIIQTLQTDFDRIEDAVVASANAPSIPGLGSVGGMQLEIQDVDNFGIKPLSEFVQTFITEAKKRPEISNLFTTLDVNTPQLFLHIDRTKAKALDVSISNLLVTLQTFLGSYYVNNFTKYGQTYRVMLQAEGENRQEVADITKLYVKSDTGVMVPLSSLVRVERIIGPYNVPHYNLYTAGMLNIVPGAGFSSGETLQAIEEVASQTLPKGIDHAWTGIVFQQLQAGNLAPIIFMLCLLFVFLFLAALYESWSMPLMILLVVPLALLGASGLLILRGLSLNIYGQIGLILLIGLAAKNAILIVEFAKDKQEGGAGIVEAAVSAATLRLRPILMTAFAFIFGVTPLMFATGAGAMSRRSIGTTVFGGMLVATILSLFIVPVFYVVIESMRERFGFKSKTQLPIEG